MFDALHKSFQNNRTDLYKLQNTEGFTRYILIRSLDNEHLEEILTIHKIQPVASSAQRLYKQLFESKISEIDIIKYIKSTYPKVRAFREDQEKHLPSIIKNFGSVACGVRNDNLNDVSQQLVRDKSIETVEELSERLDEILNNTIKGYILWQYYNQATNDLIEHLFNNHPKIIPTLRKIKYIDFFLHLDGKIIPIDLKITHISDDFFDLYHKGINISEGHIDSFTVNLAGESEIDIVKKYYKKHKNTYNLPNYGGLKKIEILEILKEKMPDVSDKFFELLEGNRKNMLESLEGNLKCLEWWNYKYQGERLFKNNNRFFIFLSYNNSFEDARPLKGQLDLIEGKVKNILDSLTYGKLNEIKYRYEKDPNVNGDYTILSTSMLMVGAKV